jgi:hypothetical protein
MHTSCAGDYLVRLLDCHMTALCEFILLIQMLQVMGGGIHGAQSPDPPAVAVNKGNETLMRAVGRLQASHSSGANASSGMPQGIKGRQLAAGKSQVWEAHHINSDHASVAGLSHSMSHGSHYSYPSFSMTGTAQQL